MPRNGAERRPTYEIRLAGRLGPALQLAFPGLRADIEPRHSVLITRAGGEALPALIERLRRRGVEVTCGAPEDCAYPPPRRSGPGTTRPG